MRKGITMPRVDRRVLWGTTIMIIDMIRIMTLATKRNHAPFPGFATEFLRPRKVGRRYHTSTKPLPFSGDLSHPQRVQGCGWCLVAHTVVVGRAVCHNAGGRRHSFRWDES